MPELTHFIKLRLADSGKRWQFLGGKGVTTYLRIHASQFEHADAQDYLCVLAKDNPNWEFKVVPIAGKK